MGISRIVWDHVVSATWVRPFSPLSPKKCMRLFSAAEALFPLVARASRAVLATSNEKIWDEGPDTWKYKYRSSYFALELAARAGGGESGGGRCAAWILAHRATRNPRKERLAVLRAGGGFWSSTHELRPISRSLGLCVGGHLDSAKQLFVDHGDDPPMAMGEGNHVGMGMGIGIGIGIGKELWTRRCGLCWPGVVGGEGTHVEFDVRDAGRWDDAENVVGCVCKAGKLEVVKWLVSRFGVTESELCGPFVEALKGGHLDVVEWLAGIVDVEGVVTREHAAVLHEAVSRSGSIKAMEWFIDRPPLWCMHSVTIGV
ncbi:hypothetical protein Pelo_9022 [Pelomyxa schiedti]|nr:hypothetical protein Pelo_9022 [Pelomyxa schiedti]